MSQFTVLCFSAQLDLLGDDGTFLISPNNYIVGNLRGKQLKLCNGNGDYPRECYPNDLWNFKVGDIIDYSWGMTGGQVGELVYGIVPSHF